MKFKKVFKENQIELLISGLFLAIHLMKLTNLPVFADEAIYIRWAQLIIDDWQRYLFFPLNDGKTPIFIWLLAPLQLIFTDQLFAGRLLAVLIGLIQIWVIKYLIKTYQGSKKVQLIGMGLASILPFWYFHHRMALMDGLLTLLLSLALLYMTRSIQKSNKIISKNTILAGFFLGLAFLSKIPALLFIPSLFTPLFLLHTKKNIAQKVAATALSILTGSLIFFSLKFHPAFGQLFSRGSDFLFSLEELMVEHKWQDAIKQIPNYFHYFLQYFTWPVLLTSLFGLATKKSKQIFSLHLNWIFFSLPIALMGKVVYPRYFLPAAISLTIAAAHSLGTLLKTKKAFGKIIMIGLMGLTLFKSGQFIYFQLTDVNKTPFVDTDKHQYLYSWSAGFGVKESTQLINKLAKDQTVLILTEGYFGTLPDGLLMYYHQENVDNIFITGIGQPIREIPKEARIKSEDYDLTLLLANSHRLKINLERDKLLFESCRPNNAPCFQVWDITNLI